MLASASIGATWTSCSPDFGIHGVLDRFGQVAPKVVFTADGYRYAGKIIDSLASIAGVIAKIPSVTRVVVVPYLAAMPPLAGLKNAVRWSEFGRAGSALDFVRLPFDHPLYVLYSSGTTGMPKCIVHGAGGTLLQHLKEHLLHTDVKPGDRLFYFTTCGWMMWNWLASGLAAQATLVLYDGSPPARPARTRRAAHDAVHRLAASARTVRLRRGCDRPGHPARVHLGRHRYRVLLRARQSALARLSRRTAMPRSRHEGRGPG
jgi:acetoacetyl-CoA synthetase